MTLRFDITLFAGVLVLLGCDSKSEESEPTPSLAYLLDTSAKLNEEGFRASCQCRPLLHETPSECIHEQAKLLRRQHQCRVRYAIGREAETRRMLEWEIPLTRSFRDCLVANTKCDVQQEMDCLNRYLFTMQASSIPQEAKDFYRFDCGPYE